MKLPGFTAEASLNVARKSYWMAAPEGVTVAGGPVRPAANGGKGIDWKIPKCNKEGDDCILHPGCACP